MYVTLTMLRDRDACTPQRLLFERIFPDGVEITEEVCLKHYADFDWSGAAAKLLPPSGYIEYKQRVATPYAVFEAACAASRNAYAASYVEAQAALAAGTAWAEYNASLSAIEAERAAATDVAAEVALRAMASAFAKIAMTVPNPAGDNPVSTPPTLPLKEKP